MSILQIVEVETFASGREHVRDWQLNAPVQGSISEFHSIKFAGWIVGAGTAVAAVEVVHEGHVVRNIPVRIPRPDVADRFADLPSAERCGFWGLVGTIGLSAEFDLLLWLVFQDGRRLPLARVQGRRSRVAAAFTPTMNPLMVTSLGRTGTTWLMRLLSEHAAVVAYRRYPYETHAGKYWMHMLKVLSDPANHETSAHPDTFAEQRAWVGHNPYYTGVYADAPQVGHWFGRSYPERLAAFCQESIEQFYRVVEKEQNQSGSLYFAEKFLPDHVPNIAWELYPGAREVFLIRDFRDMVCSMLAFNRKRGYASFGRERAATDEEFVETVAAGARRLAEAYRSRAPVALVVRYEDLVLDPIPTLSRIFESLSIDADRAMAARVLEVASRDSRELSGHRTSRDAGESVGRWRNELTAPLQTICANAFDDVLKEFGYD